MPLDYNQDGKLDLLVACPDKPSNGVWYFENAGRAGEKLPLFKAGVRLGPASHNMQVSYVAGQPRILIPSAEYTDFRKVGFESPTPIYSRSNVHDPARRIRANMWRYVDFDGDGAHDLIVGVGDWSDLEWDHAYNAQGRWRNGPLHGYVYWMKNHGTDDQPNYSQQPALLTTTDGSAIDVFGWPSPNFADFDNDGDLDLLCGEFLDGFTYFENIGTRRQPGYATGRRLTTTAGLPLVMHVQMITPTAIDWTGNGYMDLIVGDEDGRVALIEHSGTFEHGVPQFHDPVYFQQQADTLKFGALATPYIVDWDADGQADILCGNTAGNIGWFKNLGRGQDGLPKWAAPVLLESTLDKQPFRVMAGDNGSIQGPCEAKWGYTCLSAADWDRDGRCDIIYNSIFGRLGVLRATANPQRVTPTVFDSGVRELPPKWAWWQAPASDTLTQWRTTPLVLDFNGDAKLDLIALDQEGYLVLRPNCGPAERIFVDEDNQPVRLNAGSCGKSGRIKLAMVDWDSDGRLDLLVNSRNATWYRNCEDREGKLVLKKVGDLADRDVSGHTCSPTVGDLDGSGKPGLLLGAEDGRLYYIRHQDCQHFSNEQIQARPAAPTEPAKFPGFVSEEFIYQNASFPQCHASTLVETSRGLVAAWFGGTREKHPDVGIWSSYHDGQQWSAPVEWANGVQHDGKRHPCWNPVLFQPPGDAPTYLFFKVGPDPDSWWGEMMVSYDRGRSFRDRRRLPEGIDGPVRCKPILLPGGVLLAGSSTEYDGWTVHFERIQLQNGMISGPWQRIGPINHKQQFNAIQPTFLNHPSGKIQVLCRTKEGVVATSFSDDRGLTWSEMKAIDLPNNNSGVDAVTLADGRHLLIYNHLGSGVTGWGRRGLLNLAISNDGMQWHKVGILEQETRAEFSYPAIIQAADGLVHMTWTWKRQRVKHAVVNPTLIEVGEPLGLGPWDAASPAP
ncbi:MAG: exo-alpha-sialidase [Pirellulaceae bacterium]|nr:exo-alpha-sialidase [Pirellulaceae bacterium]